MKTRSLLLRFAFGALLVAAPALADAPVGQYQPFAHDDATITDAFTTLTWQRTPSDAQLYVTAALACPAGMRLPTIKELLSLVDESPHDEYVGLQEVGLYIDAHAFGGQDISGHAITPVDHPYWSATVAPPSGGTSNQWALDFKSGMTTPVDASNGVAYVRCVEP